MMKTNKTTLAVMIAGCFGAGVAMAQETQDSTKILSPVVVTATRTEQDSFDLPMAIDKVEKSSIQDAQLRMTLSESLARVPGVTAPNRNLASSDPQISSRGFGSRSTFGTRGIRVYLDGIPISNPDGIGNPGNVDLGIVESVEVMRGPFSALYGNSSGGVIQLFSEKAPATPQVKADYYTGSFNTQRSEVQAAGTQNGVEYLLDYSDFSSNGFRAQSRNNKAQATAKLGVNVSEDTKLTTIINWFDQFAQDPGGLTASEVNLNPAMASGNNVNNNARVYRGNKQVGFNLEKRVNADNAINFITYAGERYTYSYIATGAATWRNSRIDRSFYGAEARWTNSGKLLDRNYSLTAGLTVGQMEDDRKDISNANVTSRNELQKARNVDQYVQGLWSVSERWDLHGGVRHTKVSQSVRDYLPTVNGNGTGSVDYEKTTPVIGAVFKATPTLNFYANLGKGFETPTMIEVSYSDTTGNGPNLGLKPSTNTSIEVGSKWMASDSTRLNLALFDISTENELVVTANSGAYTVYGNAAKTKRQGAELSVDTRFTRDLSGFLAYSFIDATFDQTYTANGNTIRQGNVIPGTYRQQFYGELAWKHQPIGFQTAVEARYNSKVYATDTNTASNDAYTIVNLRASLQQTFGNWKVTEYARIENLFDKSFVGAIRVNDTNQRYYEPAPGRNYIVGVKANYAF